MRPWPLLILLACGSRDDAPKPEPKAVAKEPEVPTATTPPVPAKPADSKPVPGPKPPPPVTSEDRARHDKYRAAMNRGRKLTDEKKYADAIKAFDEAIAAKKSDARAVSERGFAKLLAGDLEGASDDFTEAAGASKDSRLLSQIWFNRGLVDEKRDQADNALVDFYLANKLRPSEAAKKKLAGKSVCPAHVEHAYHNSWEAKTIDAADWLALATQMPLMGDDKPTTAVDARKALGVDEPKLPAIATAGTAGSGRVVYVVVARGKQLRAIPIGEDGGARCPGETAFEVVATRGPIVHVHGTELYEGGMTEMCHDKDDNRIECTGAPDETLAGSACFGGTPMVRDLVIDTDTGKLVLVERPQMTEGADVTIKLDDKGVHLGGLDCDSVVSWGN